VELLQSPWFWTIAMVLMLVLLAAVVLNQHHPGSRHLTLVVVLWAAMDKFCEVQFLIQLGIANTGDRMQRYIYLFVGSIVVAVLTNALLLLYMLLTLFYTKSEDPERTQQQIQYLRDHRSGVTLVGFLALIKFDCLQLLFSKIAFFRDTCSAPLPEVDQDRVVVWGATGTMIEDVPQFILLVMTYKELHGAMDNFGMITCIMTGCSIVVSLINRVIAWTTMRVDRRELTLSPDELSAIVDEVTERISVGGLFAAVKAQRFEELDARSQELDARSQLLEARCQETNIQDQVAEVVRETARRRTSDLNSTSPVAI